MTGHEFPLFYQGVGSAAADITMVFEAPFQMQLNKVSVNGSNANDATIKIGTTDDDDLYMVAKAFGDSDTPAEYDRDDFVGSQYPDIAEGTIVKVTVDFDGASGTAVDDPTILLTFLT
jgi:hypothetical protein